MTENQMGEYEKETGNVIVERFKGINYVHTPGYWLRTMDHSHGEQTLTTLYIMPL